MNRPTLIILLIIGAVFIFVLGGGAGVLYQYQTQKDAFQIEKSQVKDTPQIEKSQAMEYAIKELSSKGIISMSFGTVAKIKGRDITLKSGEETSIINVKENS